jgi:hypothetical protein
MEFEFNLPVSVGIVVVLIALGAVGLVQGDMGMSEDTVLTMVVPSMAIFAAIVFAIGVKYGEYRATNV